MVDLIGLVFPGGSCAGFHREISETKPSVSKLGELWANFIRTKASRNARLPFQLGRIGKFFICRK